MRILSKLLILTVSLFLIAILIVYGARSGNLDIEIKYLVEYYLQLKQIDGKVNNLNIKNDQITIDSIVVNKNNTKFTLDNITINYSLDLNYKKSKIIADVKIDKITGQNFYSDEFFNTKMTHILQMTNDLDLLFLFLLLLD